MDDERLEVAVVGGGIIGLATALAIVERRPGWGVAVLEKEDRVGVHQTGHNSGVLHSGIYYRPGSLKARLCIEGARRMVELCEDQEVPWRRSGKLLVATSAGEVQVLEELLERGRANGVAGLRRVGPEEMREVEPEVSGVAGVLVPTAGVVDFGAAAAAIADEVERRGGHVLTDAPVTGLRREGGLTRLATPWGGPSARLVVNCAGLHADRVARMAGARPALRIVPFRGEYREVLRPELVRGLVYPVPDPRLPFLGVHLTRDVDGRVEAGPNAVLALSREGYGWGSASPRDLAEILAHPGWWRLARRHWRTGLAEVQGSLSTAAFLRSARRLVPDLAAEDLGARRSGVRAQAVAPDGSLVDDFAIEETEGAIHVLNAPSPGATASLAIGEHLSELVERALSGANGCR